MSLCVELLRLASGFAGKVPLEGFAIVMVAFGLIGAAFNMVVVAAVFGCYRTSSSAPAGLSLRQSQ